MMRGTVPTGAAMGDIRRLADVVVANPLDAQLAAQLAKAVLQRARRGRKPGPTDKPARTRRLCAVVKVAGGIRAAERLLLLGDETPPVEISIEVVPLKSADGGLTMGTALPVEGVFEASRFSWYGRGGDWCLGPSGEGRVAGNSNPVCALVAEILGGFTSQVYSHGRSNHSRRVRATARRHPRCGDESGRHGGRIRIGGFRVVKAAR